MHAPQAKRKRDAAPILIEDGRDDLTSVSRNDSVILSFNVFPTSIIISVN